MLPKASYQLHKQLDKEMAVSFLSDAKQGGIDFSQGIVSVHPDLQKLQQQTDHKIVKNTIDKYFNTFYTKHAEFLQKSIEKFTAEWQRIGSNFFQIVVEIFKHHPFPPGKYIGYISIIDCNPRFLDNKTFQVFYAHPAGVRYVTAHELLHFIFYDYALTRFPTIFEKLDTENGLFWDMAEIFNAIILHTPEFVALHNQQQPIVYPEHEKHIAALKTIWLQDQDIDIWIPSSLEFMTKERSK